jgi:hypothetical protein
VKMWEIIQIHSSIQVFNIWRKLKRRTRNHNPELQPGRLDQYPQDLKSKWSKMADSIEIDLWLIRHGTRYRT